MHNIRNRTASIFGVFVALASAPVMADYSFGRSEGALTGLSRAYGYLLGQEYSLKRIAKLYPSLQAQVRSAELEFVTTYGSTTKEKLTEAMAAGIGPDKIRQMTSRVESGIAQQVNSTPFTQQEGVNFIAEVHRRAKGEIESKVLPFLVAANYKARPASEYSANFLQKFKTQGHPKALGLNLKMNLPVSWVASEGERPHIVQKWQSMAGYGEQLITLDIRNSGGKVSKQDIQDLIDTGELKTIAPPGATFIDGGAQTVENQPGFWMDYNISVERAGISVYQVGRLNGFFTPDKLFLITCMTTTEQGKKAEAEKDFGQIKTLCPLVVNSVVLTDLY